MLTIEARNKHLGNAPELSEDEARNVSKMSGADTMKRQAAATTTMGEAMERAGMNRARLEAERLARKAHAAHDDTASQMAALDRVLRRAGDAVMIEVIGKRVWDYAVANMLRQVTAGETIVRAVNGAPKNRDGDGQRMSGSFEPQTIHAAPSLPDNVDEGQRDDVASDGHISNAPSTFPHRDGESQRLDGATDFHSRRAPSSRPLKTQSGLAAFQGQLANSLLRTYQIEGKAIGDYTVAEALGLATSKLRLLDASARPYRVLKAAAQHAANAPGSMLIGDLCSDSDIERYIAEASHAR